MVLNQGRVEQIGSPLDLYEKPANRFVAAFLGQPKMNFVEVSAARAAGRLALCLPGGRTIELPAAALGGADEKVVVGFRPDAATIVESAEGHLLGRVAVVEHLGSESLVYVAIDGMPDLLIVVAPVKSLLTRGADVSLRLDIVACHLFDASGRAIR